MEISLGEISGEISFFIFSTNAVISRAKTLFFSYTDSGKSV